MYCKTIIHVVKLLLVITIISYYIIIIWTFFLVVVKDGAHDRAGDVGEALLREVRRPLRRSPLSRQVAPPPAFSKEGGRIKDEENI